MIVLISMADKLTLHNFITSHKLSSTKILSNRSAFLRDKIKKSVNDDYQTSCVIPSLYLYFYVFDVAKHKGRNNRDIYGSNNSFYSLPYSFRFSSDLFHSHFLSKLYKCALASQKVWSSPVDFFKCQCRRSCWDSNILRRHIRSLMPKGLNA